MLNTYPDEKFKEIKTVDKLKSRYAISNHGRMITFSKSFLDGQLAKVTICDGYPMLRFQFYKKKKEKTLYVNLIPHRLVAEYYIPNNNPEKTFVLHLDFDKKNNHVSNLKWVTKKELYEFHKKNPNVIAANKRAFETNMRLKKNKLTENKVKVIKRLIFNPKRRTRMKIIARQFGISEMQLYRIKRRENWKHVSID